MKQRSLLWITLAAGGAVSAGCHNLEAAVQNPPATWTYKSDSPSYMQNTPGRAAPATHEGSASAGEHGAAAPGGHGAAPAAPGGETHATPQETEKLGASDALSGAQMRPGPGRTDEAAPH